MENLPFELLSRRATPALGEAVKSLAEAGWVFESDYWESGHNGDPYDDVKFKSPNMQQFGGIGEHDWPTITEKKLLEMESAVVAQNWAGYVFGSAAVRDPVEDALKKFLSKRKDNKFEDLEKPDKNLKVAVKISPKNKNKPKQIRITVKIT